MLFLFAFGAQRRGQGLPWPWVSKGLPFGTGIFYGMRQHFVNISIVPRVFLFVWWAAQPQRLHNIFLTDNGGS